MNPTLPAKPTAKENETLHFPPKLHPMPTLKEKLEKIDQERAALVKDRVAELRQEIADVKALLRGKEDELADLLGHAPEPAGRAPKVPAEDIIAGTLKFLAGKKDGAGVQDIAAATGFAKPQLSAVLGEEVKKKDAKFNRIGEKRGAKYILK